MRLRKIRISIRKVGRHMHKREQREQCIKEDEQVPLVEQSEESDREYACLCQSDDEAEEEVREDKIKQAREKLEGALSLLFKLEDERADVISSISTYYWQDEMKKYRKLIRRLTCKVDIAHEELKQAMREYDELRAE